MQADENAWTSGAQPLASDDPVSVGAYRLLGRLGEGGMGAVYLGLAPDGRRVAIKVIRPELATGDSFRARFDSEITNARRVASFCTARVLDHGDTDGHPYLVTEYIDGPSLEDRIATDGPLAPEPLRALAIGVATALTAFHSVRLVHRDLKPRNVMLAPDGPRVIDFGIARALDTDERHTRTGAVIGSPGWIAPEQLFDGVVSPAADVFAWGTLIAYAATGRHPYGTGNLPTLATRAQQARYDLDGVPADLQPLVRAALEPDPARRPAADGLLAGLIGTHRTRDDAERAAATAVHAAWTPATPSPTRPESAPARRARRTWPIVGAACAAVLAVSAGTAWGVTALRGDGPGGAARSPAPVAATPAAARFAKVEGVCALIPQSLIDALVPGEHHQPMLKDPVDAATGDGKATGCTWTSSDMAGAPVQRARSLHIKIIIRRDGSDRTGAMKAGADFAQARQEIAATADRTKGATVFGPLVPLAGIGDESYVATKQETSGRARFGNAILRARLANLHIELVYGGTDAPASKPGAASQTTPVPMDVARDDVEQAARAAIASLRACVTCRG
ncbi:serine/threonine-protein kinase [Actinomadura parmotrematis]|uniref:Serine/threonine protein kinase n=1 Tax=Actinomadura parmotrematis TaxID=2864039 RepID=A0ABS7G0B5_9ACTN|nr:serine/threonine-protein kinase [Actinomadura parmotrematis]MBW8485830.1 serine/threonine protein kinase [Actinomadura parmotrematis]